jgi:hypothetical protein
VLDLAVQNTLEARKPQYAQFPLRFSIQRNLVEAYVGIDPAGYAEPIVQSLDHLERQVPAEGGDKYLVLGTRREFALEMDQLDLAEAVTVRSLELADAERDRHCGVHHAAFNYRGLCEVAWRRGDCDLLASAAHSGEEAARQVDLRMELAEFLVWQGLVARIEGDETRAQRLVRQALARVQRLLMPPDRAFYEALCGFHERGGQPERALKVRRGELRTIAGMGRSAYESRCRHRVCALLARLGEPLDDDLAAAREAARKLKQPGPSLDQLDRLAAGSTTGEGSP